LFVNPPPTAVMSDDEVARMVRLSWATVEGC